MGAALAEVEGAAVVSGGIDSSRPFIPEWLTPLFHTPFYRRLTEEQRLRYNQLHACYFNEQTIFFESLMARPILSCFTARPLPDDLVSGLRVFMAEEARHSAMFRALNRQCFPQRYAKQDFFFIRVPSTTLRLLGIWVRHPSLFPLFIWLLLIEEERALFYAKEFLKASSQLEPHFVAAQKMHLADEVGHIHWDEALLDEVWPRTGRLLRRLNARLFRWLVGEFFNTPKRGGIRVIEQLVDEFPSLRPELPVMRKQVSGLARNRDYHQTLYSRAITPKSFRRFDANPEFLKMGDVLLAYTPA